MMEQLHCGMDIMKDYGNIRLLGMGQGYMVAFAFKTARQNYKQRSEQIFFRVVYRHKFVILRFK